MEKPDFESMGHEELRLHNFRLLAESQKARADWLNNGTSTPMAIRSQRDADLSRVQYLMILRKRESRADILSILVKKLHERGLGSIVEEAYDERDILARSHQQVGA